MLNWLRFGDKQCTAVVISLLLHVAVLFVLSQNLQSSIAMPMTPATMSVQFITASALPSLPKVAPVPRTAEQGIAKATAEATRSQPATAPVLHQPTPAATPARPIAALKPATASKLVLPESPKVAHPPEHDKNTPQGAQTPAKRTITQQVPAAEAPAPEAVVTLTADLAVRCPHRPTPEYPASARRLRESGRVVVKVWLNANGQVERSQVAQSSGFPRLDNAAIATVERWRCNSATRNGLAVPAIALQPFDFGLNQ